jgi:precorrin-2 dehydrogenase/sirohydrochlorin ferrochelatase
MTDFPVCLRLQGRRVLIVGGGVIAEGKIRGLVAAGAAIRVVAPEVTPPIAELVATGAVEWSARAFEPSDVQGHQFVFSATNDRSVTEVVSVAARSAGALLNAADDPEFCDFTLPSVGRRGLITVAVSTDGAAPAVAARVRRRLMEELSAGERARARLSSVVRRHWRRGPWRTVVLRWIARGFAS